MENERKTGWFPREAMENYLGLAVEEIYSKYPTEIDLSIHADIESIPEMEVRYKTQLLPWEEDGYENE